MHRVSIPVASIMDPICISIHDNNVEYLLNKDNNKSSGKGMTNLPLEVPSDDGPSSTRAMFPNRIKYIFEDDLEEHEDEEGVDYDNVFIVNMDQDHKVEDVILVSDQYQLLNYTLKQGDKTGDELDVQVISKFKDLSKTAKNTSLSKLIDIYNIQNKQLVSLCDSI